ncbi:uncharacterized protein BO96DRAFT_430708 [Aspergillus niger CBS 101883]|uniref:uncharacterized protein n=1 Tax=Aspergillus lacticoffeatus (strain CBS 101883) TaxID=1450533 RepID=UPI000D7F41E3|nr:uncharacterized protein BO96DRAFT_430708 [Aspergillus niger CBS 101883]PYH60798.1 hypothetical protein BO96DRAFT_430708 [Aspergillus niger CBS 101883]
MFLHLPPHPIPFLLVSPILNQPNRFAAFRCTLALPVIVAVECCGFSRHRAVLSSSSVLPSMNPKDLLRYLSKPANLFTSSPQILSSARPDTFAGIGIFQHEGFYRNYPSLAECQLPEKQIKGLLSQTDIAPLFVWAADSAS